MELNREVALMKNDWNEAEKTRNMLNFFFPDRHIKIEEIMHSESDMIEKSLNFYEQFREWLYFTNFSGIPNKTVDAFCKNVNNTYSIFTLRSWGHLTYPRYFSALLLYLNNELSKNDLIKCFVDIDIFTGKTTSANLSWFRHSIIKMEALIDEIMAKQAARCGKSVSELVEESQLSKEEFANIPF